MVIANEINKAIQLKLFIATYVIVIFYPLKESIILKESKSVNSNYN